MGIPVGDYHGNGLVEQGDLDLVLLNWGSDATLVGANWADGAIGQDELDGLLLNWGNSAVTSAVPEPSGMVLGLFAVIVVLMSSKWSAHCR